MKRWKLWLPTLTLVGMLAWWTIGGLQRDLLILKNGQFLLADEAYPVGDSIFYQDGITLDTMPRSEVQQIVFGSLDDPTCYQPLLKAHFQDSMVKLSRLKLPTAGTGAGQQPLSLKGNPLLPLIASGMLGLLLFLIGIREWRQYRRKKTAATVAPKEKLFLHLADFSALEILFLDLFKMRLGAPASAQAKIEKRPQKHSGPGQVLNLKVLHEDRWAERRMTLAPIGEGTSSKSQCFYVIFDTHMVVKIPPTPITDFEDYITRVQAEAKIMERLSPRICVIPNLAVILGRIHPFPDADSITPARLEDRYIRWLRRFPENQRFLTIGGTFVFFMDLARYYFLSHVAANFHSREAGLAKEIKADIDILSDLSLFEGKYGPRGGALWPPFHKAYESFRKELNRAIAQTDEPVSLSDWDIKKLYLASMAGREPDLAKLNVSVGFKRLLVNWLEQTAKSSTTLKQRYQQMLNHYTDRRLFNRCRPLMGNMVTNLLALLAYIDDKKIGLRDLKPDNLLVAGNPDDYPHFLISAPKYVIGLIDLETAVDFGNGGTDAIPQPQRGGSPLYCTPSHFFANVLLQKVYSDLPLVFHMQDWYAMIAIIFDVVTGDHLFKNTAYQVPGMMKSIIRTDAKKGNLKKKLLHFNRQFQENAASETRKKIQLHAERLRSVSAHIPEKIQQRLAEHNKSELRTTRQQLRQILDSQATFNKGNNRQHLEKSSVADLKKVRSGYKNRAGSEKLVSRFDKLIRIKQRAKTLAVNGHLLAGSYPRVTIDRLLEMMFALVDSNLLSGIDLPPPDPALELPRPAQAGKKELEEAAQVLDYTATLSL